MQRETSMRICPYNNEHIIHRARFAKHILKCAKNFPPKYKETCPFNATHIMFRSELDDHIDSCPDKLGLTPEYYTFAKKYGSLKLNTTSSECDEALTCVDTWDGDMEDRMEDFADTNSVASTIDEPTGPSARAMIHPVKPLRPPRGYGLPIMMEFAENDSHDDVESVISTLAPGGRGNRPPSMITTRSTPMIGRGGGRKPM